MSLVSGCYAENARTFLNFRRGYLSATMSAEINTTVSTVTEYTTTDVPDVIKLMRDDAR